MKRAIDGVTNFAAIKRADPEIGPDLWCERGDLNPHGLPRQILSLVRLPISPLSLWAVLKRL
jgi:hypothetical protein